MEPILKIYWKVFNRSSDQLWSWLIPLPNLQMTFQDVAILILTKENIKKHSNSIVQSLPNFKNSTLNIIVLFILDFFFIILIMGLEWLNIE
jgi:hypothetical protein